MDQKSDQNWPYPIHSIFDESNFGPGQKIGHVPNQFDQIANQNGPKIRPKLTILNRLHFRWIEFLTTLQNEHFFFTNAAEMVMKMAPKKTVIFEYVHSSVFPATGIFPPSRKMKHFPTHITRSKRHMNRLITTTVNRFPITASINMALTRSWNPSFKTKINQSNKLSTSARPIRWRISRCEIK